MNFSAWMSFDLFTLSMEMGFGPTPAREQAWPQNGYSTTKVCTVSFPCELQTRGAAAADALDRLQYKSRQRYIQEESSGTCERQIVVQYLVAEEEDDGCGACCQQACGSCASTPCTHGRVWNLKI
jgi:hypothetical protein